MENQTVFYPIVARFDTSGGFYKDFIKTFIKVKLYGPYWGF